MNYKIAISLFITALSISACKENNTQTPPLEPNVKTYMPHNAVSLDWLENASAEEDAQAALRKSDTRLWGYHDRGGAHIIGVAHRDTEKILQRYKLRTAPGISDIIYSDKHAQLRSKFIQYAKQYNQVILTRK